MGGGDVKSLPHPDEDWAEFLKVLKLKNAEEAMTWDPVSKMPKEWINIKQLQSVYGGAHGSGSAACLIS